MDTILITGVSSGTGRGLARQFVGKGYRVVGTVRNSQNAVELQNQLGSLFIPLILDITKSDQVESASIRLKHELGISYLSAIINNAGTTTIGPLLHVSLEEFKDNLNVLVVGHLCVIQHFYKFLLPSAQNQTAGKIINITSISGVGPNYLFGSYTTGKHALEGLSKTLREECEIYGIKVIVVAPGSIVTAIWDKQTEKTADKYRDTDYYDPLRKKIKDIDTSVPKEAMSVDEFVNAFYTIFNEANPTNRYTIIKSKITRLPFSAFKVRVIRR